MIPEGWNIGRVQDLLDGLESGVSVNATDRSLEQNEKAVLKISAVTYGKFNPLAFKVIESDAELERAKTNPRAGQILISRSNTEELVGASAYIENDHTNLFLPDKLWQTRSKPNAHMRWLSYVLASRYSRYTLSNLATGTSGSMKNITKGELLGLKLSIPPLPEQRKIAKILQTWDRAIATTEKLIDASKQQKKALMQQLLTGKKRFPGFEGEWEEVRFEDIVTRTQLGTTERTKESIETNCIPLIKMGNLTWGGFSMKKVETIPKTMIEDALLLHKGDFLFNTRNTPDLVGKSAVWNDKEMEATFDNNINRITFISSIDTRFLCSFMTYGKGKSIVQALPAGSTSVAAIYWKDLKNIRLRLPTLAEQIKIASVLSKTERMINRFEENLADLKQEKKALMQQLLTGKRRVKVDA